MHTFTLTLDGSQYSVVADGDTITVNEHPFTVENSGDGTVLVDGIAYEVTLAGETVTVDGQTHSWGANGLRAGAQSSARVRPATRQEQAARGGNGVVAILPGKIVRVLVEIGQPVVEGDPVCVLEAMKMENELQAPKAGTVSAIHVQAGDEVDKGQVLVHLG